MKPSSGPRRSTRTALILATMLLSLPTLGAPLHAQHAVQLRTLTGTVTDTSHEPIRGAVVELQNTASNSIQTYLTTADGHYIFKRLNSESDYSVWVVFRTRHSPSRSISKFDSHPDKVIDFKIASY